MIFQIGATLLDACVLSVLKKEDAYGYMLTQTLMNILEISESTLYHVLRRLQKEELLSTYDMPYQGRNRRYYSITDSGKQKAVEYQFAWNNFKKGVDTLIIGGESIEQ